MRLIASADGPMNVMLQLSQISAKSAFSAKKPYPGWIASVSVNVATLKMFVKLR
ncbi:hypothetical protein D3C73_1491540 [compost metagenome]